MRDKFTTAIPITVTELCDQLGIGYKLEGDGIIIFNDMSMADIKALNELIHEVLNKQQRELL